MNRLSFLPLAGRAEAVCTGIIGHTEWEVNELCGQIVLTK